MKCFINTLQRDVGRFCPCVVDALQNIETVQLPAAAVIILADIAQPGKHQPAGCKHIQPTQRQLLDGVGQHQACKRAILGHYHALNRCVGKVYFLKYAATYLYDLGQVAHIAHDDTTEHRALRQVECGTALLGIGP